MDHLNTLPARSPATESTFPARCTCGHAPASLLESYEATITDLHRDIERAVEEKTRANAHASTLAHELATARKQRDAWELACSRALGLVERCRVTLDAFGLVIDLDDPKGGGR